MGVKTVADFPQKTWFNNAPGGTPITAEELNRIEAGIATRGDVRRVVASGNVYPTRPSGVAYVEWIGAVAPAAAVIGDSWIDLTLGVYRYRDTLSTWSPSTSTEPTLSAVRSLTATQPTATSVTITWAAPSVGASSITAYEVSRDGVDSDGAGAYTGRVSSATVTATFTKLVPGSTYNFTVKPVAGDTLGPPASTTSTIPSQAATFKTRRLNHPYWTTKLATNATVAPTSSMYVSRMVSQFNARTTGTTPLVGYDPPYNTDVATGNYSICIYEMPANTPRIPVYSTSRKYYTDAVTGSTVELRDIYNAGIPLPTPNTNGLGANIAPAGSDGSIIVIDTATYELWELWRVKPATSSAALAGNYTWECSQGGYMKDYRFHPGWWSGSADGVIPRGGDFGVSASGSSYLGPILTGADFYATDITHPLTVALPITGGVAGVDARRILPATRYDEHNFTPTDATVANNYRIAEAVRFRLPPAKYTDAYITTYANANGKSVADTTGSTAATLAKVLRCARDYGIIVCDSAQVIGYSAEHDMTYATPYNPYSTAQKPAWGDFGAQIPYADLVQVEVPLFQFHEQGAGPDSEQPWRYDFGVGRSATSSTYTTIFPTASQSGVTNFSCTDASRRDGAGIIDANGVGLTSAISGTGTRWFQLFDRYQPSSGNQKVRVGIAVMATSAGVSPVAWVRGALAPESDSSANIVPSGYWARYNSKATGGARVEIYLRNNATDTLLNTTGTGLLAAVPDWIELRASGTTISAYTSANPTTAIVTVTDSTFSDGKVGFALRWTAAADAAQRMNSFSSSNL